VPLSVLKQIKNSEYKNLVPQLPQLHTSGKFRLALDLMYNIKMEIGVVQMCQVTV
jgi:hypothetical protein